MISQTLSHIAKIMRQGLSGAGLAASACAASFFPPQAASAAPTYQLSGGAYAWETAANVLPRSAFAQRCARKPIDDDQAVINFSGGFAFPFAGVSYSSVRMLTNGRLQFGDDTGAFRNKNPSVLPEGNSNRFSGCPGNLPASRIMDVAWMNLNPLDGGTMSWEQKGAAPNRRVVLSWNAVSYNPGYATFQAILYENGNAAYQYKKLEGPGSNSWRALATTGVQVSPTDYASTAAASDGTRIDLQSSTFPVNFFYQPASASGSTCAPMLYTVAARDASGATLTGYKGTMTLTALSAGSFSLASGGGVFTPRNSSTGAPATYAFAASDLGVAKFNYSTNIAESANVSFSDASAPGQSSGGAASFADNVFVIASSDPAGLDVVAGRPHAMTATLYAKDSSGTCGVATSYSGQAQDMWHSPTASHPSGAASPTISMSPDCSGPIALPSSAPGISKTSNNVSLPFVRGVAGFYLCPSDVGQYVLSARDDTAAFANNASIPSIGGSSATLTARPFGLWIDAIASASPAPKLNPGGTASSGSAFIAAGASFSARVSARKWAPGQDAIKSGSPDPSANLSGNAILPAFSWPTAISVASFTPSAGTPGSLSGSALPATSYANGSALATLSYSEAGSAILAASSPAYLGSAFPVPAARSAPIGRFIPATIALSSSALSNACPAGGYSYMGQPFGVAATLGAYGAAGNKLSNYDEAAGYQFLLSPAWKAVDSANGVDLSARTNLASLGPPSWIQGSWTYSHPSAVFARALSGPDGSYESLVLGLAGSDPDGVPISSLDSSFSAAGPSCGSSCNMKSVGLPTKARYGRLEALNAFGSILPTLKVPLRAMYWAKDSTGPLGWTPNTLDSCTSIPYSAVALGAYSGGLSAATLPASPAAVQLSLGKAQIPVTRQGGAAVSGSAIVAINLGASPLLNGGGCYGSASSFSGLSSGAAAPHLKSNFCGAPNYLGNPSAKIIWGAPAGKSSLIVFSRESY